MRCSTAQVLVGGLLALVTAIPSQVALAQASNEGRYYPLDHRIPGRVSQWAAAIQPRCTESVQQVRIELPSIGLVTYYSGSAESATLTHAPSQSGFVVGKTYRVQISGMPEFPGVELYPSIELFDQLHPPVGRESDYPIPVNFTVEEIETAINDRLVTKVIYLERPQTAVPKDLDEMIHVADLPVTDNLLQAADLRGRPMAIIRLGGRTPDPQHGSDPAFFGEQSPILSHREDQPQEFGTQPGGTQFASHASTADDRFETNFLPTSARVQLETTSNCQTQRPLPGAPACEVEVPGYEPDYYPDEYICDGGDRGIKVYHNEFGRQGLETEDTVAEFTDDLGHRRIRPSCRTCIYAPQFAAVRSASLPEVSLAVDRAAGAHDRRGTIGLHSRLTPETGLQNEQPIGVDSRSRASGMELLLSQKELDQIERLARHIKLINAFEDRLFLQRGQLDRTEEAYLAQEVQFAATWTRDLNPVIVASDAGGQEVIANFSVEEYVGIEDKSCPGDLRIIKLVDKPTAVPGDIVTFTLHYENIGDRSLYRINIVDNLTPRLEFIDGTTDSDREGDFTVDPNGEGSVIVTFELKDPLPGHTGGTLTFQCRVH
ncbi:MAG: isopeptide-forming domain-containing fimbrial protein [Planctomycetaceae bacterium]|nr:isopeptide-forming domain-containing fimbrial protein [Planctomycetaceae bacterium]